MKTFHLAVMLSLLSASAAHAHGGGLDRHGCHNDRKNGGYHCHRATGTPPASPPSDSTAAQRLSAGARPTVPGRPYRNCDEARAAGAAPVRRGDPGYGPHLDRDDDGVGCEPYRGR